MDIINCSLPCPPLDKEALFGPIDIGDILNFFDDIDDDGNKLLDKPKQRRIGKQMRRAIEVLKPNWELCALPRPPNSVFLDKDKPKPRKNDMQNASKGKNINISEVVPKSANMSKSTTLDEVALELKLESTTRKLHQDYKDIENKKRKIQIIDFQTAKKLEEYQKKPDQSKFSS